MLSMRTSARRDRSGRCGLNLLKLARQPVILEGREETAAKSRLVLCSCAADAFVGLLVGFDRGATPFWVTAASTILWFFFNESSAYRRASPFWVTAASTILGSFLNGSYKFRSVWPIDTERI